MRFERRHMIVRTMNQVDVEDYYFQHSNLSETERQDLIMKTKKKLLSTSNNISSRLVLAVEEKETGKLIGTIVGTKKGTIEEIWLSIPNEAKLQKYGYEVVDQFRKICKENWPEIKKIKLHEGKVTEMYLKKSGLSPNTRFLSVA